jgi:D-glycero-D-manno-heptose 1,7-bisphosphate phosphatase
MHKAVFLDRDGVINDNNKPVNRPEDLEIYPWTSEAISLLNKEGYYVFVVTNQGGIEMGYFTKQDLRNIHDKLIYELKRAGAIIHEIDYCPHFKTKCKCRKPSAGMLTRLAAKYEIDLKASYMIGDRNVDIDAGKNAGCKTIKIGKAYNKADYIANNLLDAVKIILDLQ